MNRQRLLALMPPAMCRQRHCTRRAVLRLLWMLAAMFAGGQVQAQTGAITAPLQAIATLDVPRYLGSGASADAVLGLMEHTQVRPVPSALRSILCVLPSSP